MLFKISGAISLVSVAARKFRQFNPGVNYEVIYGKWGVYIYVPQVPGRQIMTGDFMESVEGVIERGCDILGTMISALEDLHDEKRGGGEVDPENCPVMENCLICQSIFDARKYVAEIAEGKLPELSF